MPHERVVHNSLQRDPQAQLRSARFSPPRHTCSKSLYANLWEPFSTGLAPADEDSSFA